MQLKTLPVGDFYVNCTMLFENGAAWIVDPGADGEKLLAWLTEQRLQPAGILLTHAHFDHIGAINALEAAFPGLPVYVHPDDEPMLTHPLNQYPPEYPPIARPANLRDCRDCPVAKVIETPGHTPGGVCYYLEADRLLLSGDTLFAGSIGRTDLPGGDCQTLMKSLTRLISLPDDTKVIPGHGPTTTIAAEKRQNPFLR